MGATSTVQGNSYAFVNIELWLGELAPTSWVVGIKNISYDDNLHRNMVRGTQSVPIGLTRGQYEAKGEIEMFYKPFYALLQILGPGWRQVQLASTIMYGPNDDFTIITDLIPCFFLGEISKNHADGDDGLTVKASLVIPQQIQWNGAPSLIEVPTGIAIG